MKNSKGIWKKTYMLTMVGGLAFWLVNFAISRTAIAAEYRAAMSISFNPMLLESLIGGLIIGLCVSYPLLRFFDRIPVKDPILKSVILSSIVLVIVTILLGGPSSFYATGNVLRYFIIGTTFNVIRILTLGIAIGYVCKRLKRGINPSYVLSLEQNQNDLILIKEFLEAEKIMSVIDGCYPLSKTSEALWYFEKVHPKGKVVINVEYNHKT